MDFKKLFRNNDKAVSPVIGVILMVAITVILAAAIGSSVFSHGTAKSAPQANLNIKQGTATGNITVEHLGGDSFVYNDADWKIYRDGVLLTTGITGLPPATDTTSAISAGDIKEIGGCWTAVGQSIQLKVVDKATNQLICDKTVKIR